MCIIGGGVSFFGMFEGVSSESVAVYGGRSPVVSLVLVWFPFFRVIVAGVLVFIS